MITSVQRRRRWTAAEKVRLVEEAMQPGMTVSYVARRHGIAPSQLFGWKRRMLDGGFQAVAADEDVVGTSKVRELERRVRDLERLLGRTQDPRSRDPEGSARTGAAKKPTLRSNLWGQGGSR